MAIGSSCCASSNRFCSTFANPAWCSHSRTGLSTPSAYSCDIVTGQPAALLALDLEATACIYEGVFSERTNTIDDDKSCSIMTCGIQ